MPEKANPQKPEEQEAAGGEPIRIGVYTCQCGGNISDVVRCQQVSEALSEMPNVVVSRTDASLCSDAGQKLIEDDIRERGVNRVVIGACAPSLHERTFRGAVARAGLNPFLYYHVGIREQDSWVHHDDRDSATQKAIRLMASGLAKARLLEPLEPIELRAEQHALVIGGGVAGLRAAWDLARRGIRVTLIEKTPFLGGRVAQLEKAFPTGEPARKALHELIDSVVVHPLISVYTGAELETISGYVGDYQATIRQQPRGVSPQFSAVEAAIAACPVETPDPFNYGLTTRKAIYRPYDGAYPQTPAIDWEHCTRCGECLRVNGAGISLDDTPTSIEVNVGAVVVATGFRPYEPHHGEYGYGEFQEVVTLPQLIRLLALTDESTDTLQWAGRPVRSAALIHCVGSRQREGVNEPQPDGQVNDYCSRVCCTATLQTAHELRERFPPLHLFDLYEDMRTYGRKHEEYYTQTSRDMVHFVRFHNDEPPEVVAAPPDAGHPLLVRVKDHLTQGIELEIPVDLVVLAVGMMPGIMAGDENDLVQLLKINRGADRFLQEVHPKLRPVETSVPGVVLAGTAQGPMNIQESVAAASAAAAKAAVLLGQGRVELEPFVAQVDPDRCDGSGRCVEVCCYEGAVRLETVTSNGQTVQRAVVTPANCAGCGACVSACPNRAIDVLGWRLDQYEAMLDVIAADEPLQMEVTR
ncbi:MAG: CoB--CoM heterodisulfide reductase iron-sulfur subunit A family protein [Chloroflexota bacterium]